MARDSRLLITVTLAALLSSCGGSSSGGGNPNPPLLPNSPLGGLDQRPMNPSCVAPDRNTGSASIELVQEFQSLSFAQPLGMLQAPGDASRWFVLEKTGRVRVFANDTNTTSFATDFIDVAASFQLNTASEGGLLGMAFHPNFATNGQVYLSWTEAVPMVSVVARFTSPDGGQTLDPGTRADIIRLNQEAENHNGGQIAFGPDGFLYVGFGDGGGGGDPNDRAQDTSNLLGNILRLDVDGGTPYAIPPSNPFAGNALCTADPTVSANNCPEIYAWGLRNPWRWSFDTATNELWLGDVGQGAREEVNRISLGGNYGWDCREGNTAFNSAAASCATATNLIDPVHDYPRTEGNSITGGYVYRGSAIPALNSNYLFADFGTGRIWRLIDDGQGGFTDEELLDTTLSIASFGQGNDGELFVVDIAGGLYRINAVSGGGMQPPASVPTLLSATGCVDPQNPSMPAAGLLPYDVTVGFWSDNAVKERWLALPDGTTITVESDGDFSLPPGAVAMKHFRLGNQLVETRLLMRHPDGVWAGYTYEWDAQQSDATLVSGGKVAPVAGQSWIYPSGNDCIRCHTAAAGFSLGLKTAQLNFSFDYPSTGRRANQLLTLDNILLFNTPLGDPANLNALADPADPTAPVADQARAYLDTNCAQCHQPNGPTPTSLDLRYDTLLANTASCDAIPQAGDLGLGSSARLIAPGDPDLSVLVARMERRDSNAMPPLASNLVDATGVTLIRDWISSLSQCL